MWVCVWSRPKLLVCVGFGDATRWLKPKVHFRLGPVVNVGSSHGSFRIGSGINHERMVKRETGSVVSRA